MIYLLIGFGIFMLAAGLAYVKETKNNQTV